MALSAFFNPFNIVYSTGRPVKPFGFHGFARKRQFLNLGLTQLAKGTEMKKQAGFTLIELVLVIVILGILSAVALPKFVNLGSDARTAAMKAVEGSMRSTNSIIYAKASVANQLAVNGSVTVNGVAVTTRYGFALNVNELIKAMDLSPDFNTATANQIRHAGAPTTANCRVTYVAATAVLAPTYTLLKTGC